jgi:hypothetical protein
MPVDTFLGSNPMHAARSNEELTPLEKQHILRVNDAEVNAQILRYNTAAATAAAIAAAETTETTETCEERKEKIALACPNHEDKKPQNERSAECRAVIRSVNVTDCPVAGSGGRTNKRNKKRKSTKKRRSGKSKKHRRSKK